MTTVGTFQEVQIPTLPRTALRGKGGDPCCWLQKATLTSGLVPPSFVKTIRKIF